jgi:putative glutamine amidotransferase
VARPPVIGIACAILRAQWGPWDQPAAVVGADYVRQVQDAGGIALVIPPQPDGVDEILDVIDGLILTGGNDLEANSYGAEPHAEAEVPDPERDAFEAALVRAAIARDVPFLGICRGIQVLNVALGGTLTQHLPESHGTDDHRRSVGTFEGNEHLVQLSEGSLAARAAGETIHRVPSHHHQALDRLGDGLELTGVSVDDGVPEAVEVPGKRFALAVQWHPEADPGSGVIAALVDAARGH